MTTLVDTVNRCLAASCPVVAIPREGRVPLIMDRRRLKNSLKGLRVTSAAWEMPNAERIVIHAEGPRVRAVRRVLTMSRPVALDQVNRWAKRERAKIAAGPKPRITAKDKRLAALRESLAKLMQYRPQNPCTRSRWSRYVSRYDYEEIAEWKQAKPDRRKVSRLARRYFAGELDKTELEGLLEAAGLTIGGWGLVGDGDWQHFYQACNGPHKPERYERTVMWGGERLRDWCSNSGRAERDELRATIAAIEAI